MNFVTPAGLPVTLKEWGGDFMNVVPKLFSSKNPKALQEIVSRFCLEKIAGESIDEKVGLLTELDIQGILLASRAYSFAFDNAVPYEKSWVGKDKKQFLHTHYIPLPFENLPIKYSKKVLTHQRNRLFGRDKQAKYFDLDEVKYESSQGQKGEFSAYEYLSFKETEEGNEIDFILFETKINKDEITLLNGLEVSKYAEQSFDYERAKDSIEAIYESFDEYLSGLTYTIELPNKEALYLTNPSLDFTNQFLKSKGNENDFDSIILLRKPTKNGAIGFNIKDYSHAEKQYIAKLIKQYEGSIDMKAQIVNPTNENDIATVNYVMSVGFFFPSQV